MKQGSTADTGACTEAVLPLVSLLLPSFNEEEHIAECLDALMQQDYPAENIEVLVADGASDDATAEIVRRFMSGNGCIHLYENPGRNTSVGRNICLSHARGSVIVDYSAHAVARRDLVSTLVGRLLDAPEEVAAVGCSNLPPDSDSLVRKCIGAVMSSFFGGAASFDQSLVLKKETSVNSIAFCAYRRRVLDEIGGFDPDFWVGQDNELNVRVRKAGYEILYTPETFVHLHKRRTTGGFFVQMYRYGVARRSIIRKHPDCFKLKYVMPAVLVLLTVAVLLAGIMFSTWIVPAICAAVYAIASWISSLTVTRAPLTVLVSPFFFFVQHCAYGLGLLTGASWGGRQRGLAGRARRSPGGE